MDFAEFMQSRDIIAKAVGHGEYALSKWTEISADDASLDPRIQATDEKGVHPAARNSHRPETVRIEVGTTHEVIDQPFTIQHTKTDGTSPQMKGERGDVCAG